MQSIRSNTEQQPSPKFKISPSFTLVSPSQPTDKPRKQLEYYGGEMCCTTWSPLQATGPTTPPCGLSLRTQLLPLSTTGKINEKIYLEEPHIQEGYYMATKVKLRRLSGYTVVAQRLKMLLLLMLAGWWFKT